ncbi:MAG TPA: bifunctional precorrin-2 dehydrogenase/sirohydrochlorin ferrochelatase [Longimicrobium sp.]|nr:bifunctional precorrin-2 dehydrogenase/sirohydrochlorin ferrochelatase [Longimicrobium sp.]
MSGLYPVFVDAARLKVLVVGGGEVALRKARGVTEAGGRPTVVAPALHDELRALIQRLRLVWHPRPYETGDARGHHLVFAATDAPAVNAAVAREAEAAGALVTLADDGEAGTFQVPAVIRRDDVVVAFSTGGASPLLARRLRERLEGVVTPGLGRAAGRLARLREELKARFPGDEARRRAAWFSLVTEEFVDAAVAGRDEDVETRIARCLSQS